MVGGKNGRKKKKKMKRKPGKKKKKCSHTPTWVKERIERCKNCNTLKNRLKGNQKEVAIENTYT